MPNPIYEIVADVETSYDDEAVLDRRFVHVFITASDPDSALALFRNELRRHNTLAVGYHRTKLLKIVHVVKIPEHLITGDASL